MKQQSVKNYRQEGEARSPSELGFGEIAVSKDGSVFAGDESDLPVSQTAGVSAKLMQYSLYPGTLSEEEQEDLEADGTQMAQFRERRFCVADNECLFRIRVVYNGTQKLPGAKVKVNSVLLTADDNGLINYAAAAGQSCTFTLATQVAGGTTPSVTKTAEGGQTVEVLLDIQKNTSVSQKVFTASEDILLSPEIKSYDVFLVGGGGGGGVTGQDSASGGSYGGGGGGGYTTTQSNLAVTGLTSVSIVVGAGGTGAEYNHSQHKTTPGTAGGASTVTIGETVYQAKGGSPGSSSSGGVGGSNGGSGSGNGGSDGVPGQGTTTRAFGESSGTLYAGGGGGAGGYGGDGGGGNGSTKNQESEHKGLPGTANTGGGGGGGFYEYSSGGSGTHGFGGNGGSGIVILRWRW